MISNYGFVPDEDNDDENVPNSEKEFFNAKSFLLKASTATGDNL